MLAVFEISACPVDNASVKIVGRVQLSITRPFIEYDFNFWEIV